MLSNTVTPPTPSATPSPTRAHPHPRLTVTCIGAGYVGGPSMAVLALQCPDVDVWVADLSAARIAAWQSDNLPIYEPGLLDTVRQIRAGARNLHFTTDVTGAIARADVVYVAVNTPTKVKGEGAGHAPDLRYIESATRMIARATPAGKHLIVVEKSTVPCRTAETVRAILSANAAEGATFEVLSNPEFLAEGTAIKDLMHPDRVLVGCLPTPSGTHALGVLADLYAKWIPRERIVPMNLWSSELAKLAANAMLAQRITSINTLSAVCERTGADVSELARAVGLDTRIGGKFLGAGVGYGGSCFKKDVLALSYLADALGLPEVGAYWRCVDDMNEWQKRRFARNVVKRLHGTVAGKKIALLGYAFKADTGDTRESPATNVAAHLLADGAHIHIYDPKADREHVLYELRHAGVDDHTIAEQVEFTSGAAADAVQESHGAGTYVACAGASAVVVCTAWAEFKNLDWARIYAGMPDKPAFVFDGRLCLDHAALRSIGFVVDCVGKPDPCMLEDPAAKEMRSAAVKAAPLVDVERVVDQVVLKSAPTSPSKKSRQHSVSASPSKHSNSVLARGDSVVGAVAQ